MFKKACKEALKYTRPIIIGKKYYQKLQWAFKNTDRRGRYGYLRKGNYRWCLQRKAYADAYLQAKGRAWNIREYKEPVQLLVQAFVFVEVSTWIHAILVAFAASGRYVFCARGPVLQNGCRARSLLPAHG